MNEEGIKYSGAIWSAVILIWITICAACVSSIVYTAKSCSRDLCSSCDSVRIIKYPYFDDIDEQLKQKTLNLGDSQMIEELWKNQKYLYSQRDNLLADVRQETNNSIEKITSELNFWVAILAFLGVLVPIAITHRGEREARNWLEKQASLLEKKESIYDEKIRTAIAGSSLKIKEWSEQRAKILSDLSCRFDDTTNKLDCRDREQKKLIEELKLQRDVEMMTSIRNNRFIETESELRQAYNETARDLIKRFLLYLDNQIQNYIEDPEHSDKHDLTTMSILFFDVINNLKLSHTDPSRPRILYQAEDSIKELIKILLDVLPSKEAVQQIIGKVKINVGTVLNKL